MTNNTVYKSKLTKQKEKDLSTYCLEDPDELEFLCEAGFDSKIANSLSSTRLEKRQKSALIRSKKQS